MRLYIVIVTLIKYCVFFVFIITPFSILQVLDDNQVATGMDFPDNRRCSKMKWDFIKRKCYKRVNYILVDKKCRDEPSYDLRNDCRNRMSSKSNMNEIINNKDSTLSIILFLFLYVLLPLALFSLRSIIWNQFEKFLLTPKSVQNLEGFLDRVVDYTKNNSTLSYVFIISIIVVYFCSLMFLSN